MKKEEIKYFCDICGENTKEKDIFQVNYPVIFTTNQTDGVNSKPYLEQKQIDICRHCADKVLKITASGCQGYNEYKVINEGTKWQKLKEWLKEIKTSSEKQMKEARINTDYYTRASVQNLAVERVLQQMQELEGEDE